MDDSFDLYGDLLPSAEPVVPEDSKCHKELAVKTELLEKELNVLKKQLEDLESVNKNLKLNFSSLIKTAKSEISRKDNVITDLRSKLDSVTFRRNRCQPYPKRQEPPIVNGIPSGQDHQATVDHSSNYPPSLLTLKLPSINEYVDRQVVANDHPGTEIVKQEHINIKEDPGDVDEECDKVTTDKLEYKKTLYGERLHKKIMEIEESEKKKKAEENVKRKEEELRLKHAPSDKINNKENLSHQIDRESISNKISDDMKNNVDAAGEKSEMMKMEESSHVETNFIKNGEDNWPKSDKHFNARSNSIVSNNNQWYSHNSKHENRNSPVNEDYRNRYHDTRRDNHERHRYNTSRYKESISKYNRRDRDNNSRYDYHKNSNHHSSRSKEEIRGRYATRDDTIKNYEKERRKRENMETLKRMRRSVSEDRILHDSKRRRISHEDLIHSCNSRKEFIEMSDSSHLKSRKHLEESEGQKKKHDLEKLTSDRNWVRDIVKPIMMSKNSQSHVLGESIRRHNDNKIINDDKEIKEEMASHKLRESEKCLRRIENSREKDVKTSKSNERKLSENIDTLQPEFSMDRVKKEEFENANDDQTSKFEQSKENDNLDNRLNGIAWKHEKSTKRNESSREKDAKTSKCNERKTSETINALQPASTIQKMEKEQLENANNDATSKFEHPKANDNLNNELNGIMKHEKSSKPKESSREKDVKTSKCNERKVSETASSMRKRKIEELQDANEDVTSKFEQPKENDNLDDELNGIIKHEKHSKRKESSREKETKTSTSNERKASENIDDLQPESSIQKLEKEELKNANNDVTSKFEHSKANDGLNSELNGIMKHGKSSKRKESSREKDTKVDKCNKRKVSESIDTLQPVSSDKKVKKEELKNVNNAVTSKFEHPKENDNLADGLNGIIKHEKHSKRKESSREKEAKTSKGNEKKASENIDALQPESSIKKEELKNANNDVINKFEHSKENDNLDDELNEIINSEKSAKQKESSCEKNEKIQDSNNTKILRTEKSRLKEIMKGSKSNTIDNSNESENFERKSEIIEPVENNKPTEKNVNSQERCIKVKEGTEKEILEKTNRPKTKETRIGKEQISSHNNKVVNNVDYVHQNGVLNDHTKNVKSLVGKEISNDRDKSRDRRKGITANDDNYGVKKTEDLVKSRNSNKVIEDRKSLRETDTKTKDHRGKKTSNKINDDHEKGRTEKTWDKVSEKKKNQMKSLFSNETPDNEKLKQKRISHYRDKRSDNKSKTVREKLSSEKKEKEYSSKRKERNDNTKITLSNDANDREPAVKEETPYERKYLAEELEDGEIIDDEIVEDDLLRAKPGNSVNNNPIKISIKTEINPFISTESEVETHRPNNNEFENVTEKVGFHTNIKKESESLTKSHHDKKSHGQVTIENQTVKNINQIETCVEESRNEKELLEKSNLKSESIDEFQLIHEQIDGKSSKKSASNTKSKKQRSNIDESNTEPSLIPKTSEESNKETCLIQHNKEEIFKKNEEIYTQKSQVKESTVKNMHSEPNTENISGIIQNKKANELKADETTCGQKEVSETHLHKKETNTPKKKNSVLKFKEIKNIIVVKRRRITRTENKLTSNSPESMKIIFKSKETNPDLGSANKVESDVVCSKTEENKNNKMPANVIAEKLEEQIKPSTNIEIRRDAPDPREEINEESNIEIDEKKKNSCDSNKLLQNTNVESSKISTGVRVSKVNSKKQSVSIEKPNTIKNVILVKRRRRPVQLADSPSVKVRPQSLN